MADEGESTSACSTTSTTAAYTLQAGVGRHASPAHQYRATFKLKRGWSQCAVAATATGGVLTGTPAVGAGGGGDVAAAAAAAATAAAAARRAPLVILMCSSDSTWLRQMGHLLVCLRSSCAHSWHMHLFWM